MASSTKSAGATLLTLKLMNRSITSASPMTEQAINGQMGQPAACMMENNAELLAASLDREALNYGPAVALWALTALWITLCVTCAW